MHRNGGAHLQENEGTTLLRNLQLGDLQLCCTWWQEASVGREKRVLFSLRMNGAGTFGAGVPESAGFCDVPGPGMALEQNSFPAATSPGLAQTVIRRTKGAP